MNESFEPGIPLNTWFSNSHSHSHSQGQSQCQCQCYSPIKFGTVVNIMLHEMINSDGSLKTQLAYSLSELYGESLTISGFSFGFHPWFLENLSLDQAEQSLLYFGKSLTCRAIGETGLDALRGVSHDQQLGFFRMHLSVAKLLGRPLVIHCVRRHQEVIAELKRGAFCGNLMVHGFSSRWAIASMWLSVGAFLSFGEALINGSLALKETFIKCPLDKILLETDDSIIDIGKIYKEGATLKAMNIDHFTEQINKNYLAFYNG